MGIDEATDSRVRSRPGVASTRALGLGAGEARPRHEEKVTFYCTFEELTRLEESRLKLRREMGIVTDRGGIIRAAVTRALDELERQGRAAPIARLLSDLKRATK